MKNIVIPIALLLMTVAACKKDASSPAKASSAESTYYITATIDGTNVTFDTLAMAYSFGGVTSGSLQITGFASRSNDSATIFSGNFPETLANFIDLAIGYDSLPAIGNYTDTGIVGENWCYLAYSKYINTTYQPNYEFYINSSYWAPTSTFATVTALTDSTIEGTFYGKVYFGNNSYNLATDSTRHITITNGKFYVKISQ